MTIAFLFPGQGTQHVGMGAALRYRSAAARRVLDEGAPRLLALMASGPHAELDETSNAQPAVTLCNAAALAELRSEGVDANVVAGHSVGEMTALHAAGVLSLAALLDAVTHRGRLMATVDRHGAMISVIGLTEADVIGLCDHAGAAGTVVPALFNGPRHVVLSGDVAGIDAAADAARRMGALRVTRLAVSHAFHSPLMAGARDRWASYVEDMDLRPPDRTVVLSTTGGPAGDVADIRRALVDQLCSPVQWLATLRTLVAIGVTSAVEVGESKVLAAMSRQSGVGLPTHVAARLQLAR